MLIDTESKRVKKFTCQYAKYKEAPKPYVDCNTGILTGYDIGQCY